MSALDEDAGCRLVRRTCQLGGEVRLALPGCGDERDQGRLRIRVGVVQPPDDITDFGAKARDSKGCGKAALPQLQDEAA